jgi:hypothetical protein
LKLEQDTQGRVLTLRWIYATRPLLIKIEIRTFNDNLCKPHVWIISKLFSNQFSIYKAIIWEYRLHIDNAGLLFCELIGIHRKILILLRSALFSTKYKTAVSDSKVNELSGNLVYQPVFISHNFFVGFQERKFCQNRKIMMSDHLHFSLLNIHTYSYPTFKFRVRTELMTNSQWRKWSRELRECIYLSGRVCKFDSIASGKAAVNRQSEQKYCIIHSLTLASTRKFSHTHMYNSQREWCKWSEMRWWAVTGGESLLFHSHSEQTLITFCDRNAAAAWRSRYTMSTW